MTHSSHDPHRYPAESAFGDWVLAIATALLVLLIAGVLPRILS